MPDLNKFPVQRTEAELKRLIQSARMLGFGADVKYFTEQLEDLRNG